MPCLPGWPWEANRAWTIEPRRAERQGSRPRTSPPQLASYLDELLPLVLNAEMTPTTIIEAGHELTPWAERLAQTEGQVASAPEIET